MRRVPFLAFIFFSLAAATVGMRAVAQSAPGGDPSQGDGGPGGGPGGGPREAGGGRPPAGFHLLPRFVEERLQLGDDQKQQMDQLEKDTKAKLAKILTADQMKIVNTARPPRPGAPDAGDQGGPPDGPGAGAPGGDPGPPN